MNLSLINRSNILNLSSRRSFHTLETVIAFDSNKFKVTELPPNHLQMELTPAEKLLKEVNLSLTRQRVAVLELFLKEEHPMTPHEVREILEDQEHVDQVTIYRVLEALVRTRLLTQVPVHGSEQLLLPRQSGYRAFTLTFTVTYVVECSV
jgi:predicted HTH transcriptional regulator